VEKNNFEIKVGNARRRQRILSGGERKLGARKGVKGSQYRGEGFGKKKCQSAKSGYELQAKKKEEGPRNERGHRGAETPENWKDERKSHAGGEEGKRHSKKEKHTAGGRNTKGKS